MLDKRIITIIVFMGTFLFLLPINTYAFNNNILKNNIHDSIYVLDNDDFEGISNVDESGIDMSKYNKTQSCEKLLGDPNNPESVAWLLQEALSVLKIVGPLLVVVLSSFDFAKVIISGDTEAMNKAGKKLGMRLVLAVALFFVPILVTTLLDVFGIMGDPTCGLS